MGSEAHKVLVVEVRPEPHFDADTLSVVRIMDGYTCVIKTESWAGVTKAAWVPPDSLVDTTKEVFAFLAEDAGADGFARIKARKLRKVPSYGLLVPIDDKFQVGDDVTEHLNVRHWVQDTEEDGGGPGAVFGGENVSGPKVYAPYYDISGLRAYGKRMFAEGEPVICTEKLEGCASKYVFMDGEFHCSSRNGWKKEFANSTITVEELVANGVAQEKAVEIVAAKAAKPSQQNLWWKVLRQELSLQEFLKSHPGWVVYGEVYGQVKHFKYGCKDGEMRFAAYDIMRDGKWVNSIEARKLLDEAGVPQVPLLNQVIDCVIQPIPFDFDKICEMAEGKTTVAGADHVREGVVVKSIEERENFRYGRAQLKLAGLGYEEVKHSKKKNKNKAAVSA